MRIVEGEIAVPIGIVEVGEVVEYSGFYVMILTDKGFPGSAVGSVAGSMEVTSGYVPVARLATGELRLVSSEHPVRRVNAELSVTSIR